MEVLILLLEPKYFGGIHFNQYTKHAALDIVSLENNMITEEQWTDWDKLQPKVICDNISHCKLAQKCECLMYDSFQIDDIFRKRLDQIPNIYGFELTPSEYYKIYYSIMPDMRLMKIQTSSDNDTGLYINHIKSIRFDQTSMIPFPWPDTTPYCAMAFVFAAYQALRFRDYQ